MKYRVSLVGLSDEEADIVEADSFVESQPSGSLMLFDVQRTQGLGGDHERELTLVRLYAPGIWRRLEVVE